MNAIVEKLAVHPEGPPQEQDRVSPWLEQQAVLEQKSG